MASTISKKPILVLSKLYILHPLINMYTDLKIQCSENFLITVICHSDFLGYIQYTHTKIQSKSTTKCIKQTNQHNKQYYRILFLMDSHKFQDTLYGTCRGEHVVGNNQQHYTNGQNIYFFFPYKQKNIQIQRKKIQFTTCRRLILNYTKIKIFKDHDTNLVQGGE